MKHFLLGDLIDIKHGFAFSGEYIQEEDNGVVLVTPGNFRIGGGFQEDKCKFFSGEIPDEFILNAGDFIVTMTDLSKTIDTLGYSAYVPDSQRVYLHNQRIGLVTQKSDECDRGYLYWLMRSYFYQRTIANTSTGATVHHTSPSKICAFEFDAPEIDVQRKIAEYLSAYDDLIENNQKQIKLLEEATQRLYKEWFMDLRFPGYENTEIDNGIPTGWHMGTLGEIVEFRRGKTITKAQVKEGNVPVVAGGLEPAYYHNEANTKAPVITVSGSGANAGFSRMYHEDVFASDCSFADIQGTKSISFVYCFLKANKYQLDALQKGSAQPHVYAKDINAMEILIPQSEMITHYCAKVDVLFNKIGVLQKQMAAASEARDRLLPKLMSGEIEL